MLEERNVESISSDAIRVASMDSSLYSWAAIFAIVVGGGVRGI